MTDTITPFRRLSGRAVPPSEEGMSGRLRLMRLHFSLAGVLLFVGAVGLVAYQYNLRLRRIDVGWDLRIGRVGKIYETDTQLQLFLALVLGVASLVQFQAAKHISQRWRRGLPTVRMAAVLLLVGFPAGVVLWNLNLDVPGLTPGRLQMGLRIAAGALFIQSSLALWYTVSLWLGGLRRVFDRQDLASRALGRVRLAGAGLWIALVLGLALALAVMTDLIELSLPRPQPGELLYASTFEALNDEWDIYGGRDSVAAVDATTLGVQTPVGVTASLNGSVLLVTHGSPYAGEIVWATVDRKFNDLDLRVTAQRASGPVDNQYGVIFRYRDPENFYIFRLSSDGWYSLAKVKNDVQEQISDWNTSEAIRQENGANEIRVVARGDEFRFYVNGQPMPLCFKGENANSMWVDGKCFESEAADIYQDGDFKQGGIALVAGTINGEAVAIAFDDLLIVAPDPDVMTASLTE